MFLRRQLLEKGKRKNNRRKAVCLVMEQWQGHTCLVFFLWWFAKDDGRELVVSQTLPDLFTPCFN
jgi:hypothetical protein